MTERDPLGLSADQREISDLSQSGLISERSARLLADMTMVCPLCRSYECPPGCLSRIDWPNWPGNVE